MPSLAALLLPGVVAAFRAERPGVEVMISDALADEVLERVRSGRADLAVTVAPEDVVDLAFRPIVTDGFHVVFPPGHPLGEKKAVEWTALRGLPFVRLHPTSSVRSHVDRALATADVRVGPVTEVRNVAAVGGLVAAGEGLSAVPGLVLPLLAFAGLDHRPLRGPRGDPGASACCSIPTDRSRRRLRHSSRRWRGPGRPGWRCRQVPIGSQGEPSPR